MFAFKWQRDLLLAVVVVLGIAACGNASGHANSSVRTPLAATVEGEPITQPELSHQMSVDAAENLGSSSDPTAYRACVAAYLPPALATETQVAKPGSSCTTQITALRVQALNSLIAYHWLLDEARAVGSPVLDTQAQAKLQTVKAKLFKSEAEFQAALKISGRTEADLLFELELTQAAENLHKHLRSLVPVTTAASIRSYYRDHQSTYAVLKRRNVKILRTTTRAEAFVAKREIASGKSFVSVARATKVAQPAHAINALVLELKPGTYAEPKLSKAIFAAKLDTLTGPVTIRLGSYVFEAKSQTPGYERPLKQVEAQIRGEIAKEAQTRTFAAYMNSWKRRWTARTHCQPGFVVPKCSEYMGPTPKLAGPIPTSEDAFTVDLLRRAFYLEGGGSPI
jgi:PPIC-type PPIASE domain